MRLRKNPESVVFLVGAGVSIQTSKPKNGPPLPTTTWPGLLASGVTWARDTRLVSDGDADIALAILGSGKAPTTKGLMRVAEDVSQWFSGAPDEYGAWLEASVGHLPIRDKGPIHALDALGGMLVTTNYDDLIERVSSRQRVFTWKQVPDVRQTFLDGTPSVLHLHGHFAQPDTVVLGPKSYDRLLADKSVRLLRNALAYGKLLVFVGFGAGISDPNFGDLRRLLTVTDAARDITHIRLTLADDLPALRRTHAKDNIHPVPFGTRYSDLEVFLRGLKPHRSPAKRRCSPDMPPAQRLVGTGGIVDDVVQRLLTGTDIVLLGAVGGSGKTAVALAVAARQEVAEAFPDGTLWASLGQAPDLGVITRSWARALGMPAGQVNAMTTVAGGAMTGEELLRKFLLDKRCLILIDDAWSTEAARALRVGGVRCAHLATTRRLSVAQDLRGANDPPAVNIDALDTARSIELLRDRAPTAVGLRESDIRDLAEAVFGLPASLVVLARLLENEAQNGIEGLDAEIALLREGLHSAHAYELPLEGLSADDTRRVTSFSAILDRTTQALSEPARKAAPDITALPKKADTFSSDLARVAGDLDGPQFSEIREFGLVEATGARYWMHQVHWDYLRLQQHPAARVRVAEHLIQLMKADVRGAGRTAWLDSIRDEMGSIRYSLDSLVQDADRDRALRLAGGLGDYLYERSLFRDGMECLGCLVSVIAPGVLEGGADWVSEGPMPEQDLAMLAKCVNDLGTCAYNLGETGLAEQAYTRGKELRTALKHRDLSGSLNNVGLIHRDRGAVAKAKQLFGRALKMNTKLIVAEPENDRHHKWAGINLDNLAVSGFEFTPLTSDGMHERSLLKSAGEHFTNVGWSWGQAMVTCDRGKLQICLGNLDKARQLILESLRMRTMIGDERGQILSMMALAHVELVSEDGRASESKLGAALDAALKLGEDRLTSECMIALAATQAGGQRSAAGGYALAWRSERRLAPTRLVAWTQHAQKPSRGIDAADVQGSQSLRTAARALALTVRADWTSVLEATLRAA
ncbi:NB-ARC domain-containing protein [Terrabacter sp. Root181]|uniref:NB-ARC domain-containing protein n=1 Tax=Terrabacter sp. Root181 TaxID=1736484 RepID=UPI00138F5474|nr:NB-ARC domain-containing protein [Terrabacter sp. Root181]